MAGLPCVLRLADAVSALSRRAGGACPAARPGDVGSTESSVVASRYHGCPRERRPRGTDWIPNGREALPLLVPSTGPGLVAFERRQPYVAVARQNDSIVSTTETGIESRGKASADCDAGTPDVRRAKL